VSLSFAIPALVMIALFGLIVTLIVVRNRRKP